MKEFSLCQRCSSNPAVGYYFTQNEKGQSIEHPICSSCAKELGLLNPKHSTPSNGINDLIQNVVNQFFDANDDSPSEGSMQTKTRRGTSILDKFTTNLTRQAEQNKLDPVIGRDDEIQQMIRILNRRNKNNPVLIGESGVGKTAIVEGLSSLIISGHVPDKLKDKEILSLHMSNVVANTSYRGQFEERMKNIISEVSKNPNIILFIDEIHTIVGAGSAQDSKMDAANILKPFLSRRDIQLIGATTLDEYRIIEKDNALERRFQQVMVNEPSLEQTVQILKGLKGRYEKFHQTVFSDDILTSIVSLSDRYISDRFMPDKAIDVLDEVGSCLNLTASPIPPTDSIRQFKVKELLAAERSDYKLATFYKMEIAKLKATVTETKSKKELQELEDIEQEINSLSTKELIAYPLTNTPTQTIVTLSDVEFVISNMTGIPVTQVTTDDISELLSLETRLGTKVIGQEHAVKEVSRAVQRHRMNIRKQKKPATFFFTGPTGVGKTELTRQLAEEVFKDQDAVIRFDMSEYMESHSISKLIGSPPGYIGHEEAGQLTEKVRRKPYSIILLDEFEKAHAKVSNLFLQVFEDGRLTDAKGKTVDFSNTFIIMTSNLGSNQQETPGFLSSSKETQFISSVEQFFPKEFINRIDAIIPFSSLKQEHTLAILDLMLKELYQGLVEKGITLELSPEAKEHLATKGYSQVYGARPLYRTIINLVDNPITEHLLTHKNITSIYISLDPKTNNLVLK